MVRRINAPSSSRLLFSVLCFLFVAMFAQAQSSESSQQRSSGGSTFIVAPTVHLSASATSVASGDLNGDGKLDLVITSRGSGSVTVLLGNGKGGFARGVEYPAGKQPGNVLLADLSGAGKLDIVVTDSATGSILALRGNGDGTFAKAVSHGAIANPVAMVLGNFGGKGKIDIAAASATGLVVLLNDGAGHLSATTSIPLAHSLTALAAADLKANGRDDLFAANADGTVSVLEGDGKGGFSAHSAVKVSAGALSSIVAGDFNHDGRADLAVAQTGSSKLTVLLGRGDATFVSGVDYTVGNSPAHLIAVDLKGDGKIDLVAANAAANTFSVLAGKGDGTFKSTVDFAAGNSPLAIAAGDFSGGGHVDLAIVNSGDATISMPQGKGDGTFHAALSYRTGLEQKSIASGDLTGKGLNDLVVTNFCGEDATCKKSGVATVMLANTDGTYRKGATYELGSGPVAVALAELTGDKKLDLVVANRNDKTLLVLPGKGNGSFGEPVSYALSANPRAIFAGDFGGHGKPGLAIATDCGRSSCTEPGNVEIWLTGANGKLSLSASHAVGFSPVSIAAGDLRGSGHLDLVIANACGNDSSCKSHGTATILKDLGYGRFADGGEVDLGSSPSSIAIGALTGNGLDLVVAERGSNRVDVLHSDGKGGFGEPASYKAGVQPAAISIADFDGDGRMDVAVANFKDSTVSVLRGTSTGTLAAAVHYSVGSGPESMVSVKGGRIGASSLITANGNVGATPMGADITVLRDAAAATTTVMQVPLPNTSTVNDSVTLEGDVTPMTGGGNVATGNVEFDQSTDGVNFTAISDCASKAVNTVGIATCVTHQLVAPTSGTTITLQAQYLGANGVWSPSTSDPQTQTTTADTTTTTAVVSSTPTVDKLLTVTATVNATGAAVPMTGNVTFTGNLPGCSSVAVPVTFSVVTSKGTASCTATAATATASGSPFTVDAAYSSDPNYSNSALGAALNINIAAQNTTTKLASSANPTKVDEVPTITATVAPPTGVTGSVPISGNVTFNGTLPGCISVVVPVVFSGGTATASCTPAATLPQGTYSITGTYSGDGNYNGSGPSTAVSQVVNKETTATVVTSSASPTSINTPPTLTATISPSGTDTASVTIGGTVTFKIGGTAIGACTGLPVTFDSTNLVGVATCPVPSASLSVGNNSVTAVYLGDSNYATSTSPAFIQDIGSSGTSTVVTATANPSVVDQPLTYTATITPPVGSTVTMHGTVTFTNNSAAIPGCAAAASVTFAGGVGTATCTPTLSSLVANNYSIVGAYSGDANYGGSTSPGLAEVVNQASTTASVATSSPTSTTNGSLTFTATVSPVTGTGAVAINGTESFAVDGATIPGCSAKTVTFSASTGVATCTTTLLSVGAHNITTVYGGNTNYLGSSTSAPVPVTVSAGNSTVSVSAPGSSTVDAPVTMTATVGPSPSVAAANTVPFLNTGTVSFFDGTTAITACATIPVTYNSATGTASASCSYAGLTASGSPHSLKASYSGDTDYNGSSTASGASINVTKSGTTTVLISSSNPVPAATNVTFTATVAPPSNPGTVTIGGTVEFKNGSTDIPTCSAVSIVYNAVTLSGSAQCTASFAGSSTAYPITAVFSGDGNYTGSTSTSVQESVGKTAANTSLTPVSGASNVNGSVTFTETIVSPSTTGAAPTGTVSFANNGNALTNNTGTVVCSSLTVTPGTTNVSGTNFPSATATCTTTLLSAGVHTIQATYSGDTSYAITTNTTIQTVTAIASATTLAAAPTTSVAVNQGVSLTATVTPAPSGSRVPLTGTVTFTDNGSPLTGCAPSFNASTGVATCTDLNLTPVPHSIVATYGGDNSYTTSSSTGLAQVVTPAAAAVAAVSSTNPSAVNQAVTFNASVTAPSGPIALSGNVTFTDNGVAIADCPAVKVSNIGTASCTTSKLKQGSHTIAATYGSDTNFTASAPGTVIQTVEAAFTTTTLVSSLGANPSTVDSPIVFTATVTSAKGSAALTGNVAFSYNGGAIAACNAQKVNASGVATCTTSALKAGADVVVATYGHDTSFTGSSITLPVAVNAAPSSLALSSSLSPSVVNNPQHINDKVTFTASVTPSTFTNPATAPVALSGTVSFLDNDVPIDCQPLIFTPSTGVATCTTNVLTAGSDNIHALYQLDPNYVTSDKFLTQLVADYSLGVFTTPPVVVTQGFTTADDPIQTKIITLAPTSTQNYTGVLSLKCSVVAAATGSGAVPPVCGLTTTTLAVAAGAIQQSVGITVDATNAGAGSFNMMVTGTDAANGLQRSSTPLAVSVRSAASLTVISGATTNNTQTVKFVLPAGVAVSGIGCPTVSGPTLPAPIPTSSLNMSCTVNPSSIPSSTSTQEVSVLVTVDTSGATATASAKGQSTILTAGPSATSLYAAASLMTIPMLLLVGLVRRRRLAFNKAQIFRMLAFAAVLIGGMQVIGCGGSFKRTTTSTGGATPPGSYDLLIQGTGTDKNKYQAVLKVNVTL